MKVTVPATFLDDHVGRGCPFDEIQVVAQKDQLVTIECSGADVHELRSDAAHYVALGVRELGQSYLGLVSSARATVRRIDKAFTQEQLAAFAIEARDLELDRQAAFRASPAGIAQAEREAARRASQEREDIEHPLFTRLPVGTEIAVDGVVLVLGEVPTLRSYTYPNSVIRFVATDGRTVDASFETKDFRYPLRVGRDPVGDRVVLR